jgi:hypothetical protein
MEEETPSPQAHGLWKNLKTKTEDNKVNQTKNSHIYEKRRKHGKRQKLASTVPSLALFLLPSALAAAPLTTTLISVLNLFCTFLALH